MPCCKNFTWVSNFFSSLSCPGANKACPLKICISFLLPLAKDKLWLVKGLNKGDIAGSLIFSIVHSMGVENWLRSLKCMWWLSIPVPTRTVVLALWYIHGGSLPQLGACKSEYLPEWVTGISESCVRKSTEEQDVPNKALSLLPISCLSCQQAEQRLLLSSALSPTKKNANDVLMLIALGKTAVSSWPLGPQELWTLQEGATLFTAHGIFHSHKNWTVKKATFSFSPRINVGIYYQKQQPDHLVNCNCPGKSLNFLRVTFMITSMDV